MRNKSINHEQATFDLTTVNDKIEDMSATVSELRTGIFAPITKISSTSIIYKNFVANKRERKIETKWGNVVVTGNILTQVHRDILDAIFATKSEVKDVEDGKAVYFKLADISKALNPEGDDNFNYKWIKQKIKEIQTTAIEFRYTDSKNYVSFNFINKAAFSEKHGSFGIVFTHDYLKFIDSQMTVSYKDELQKLLKVENALIKAIIRFFWTHQHCNISVEQILISIGYPVESERAIRDAKKAIKDNKELLSSFNIIYNAKENLLYSQDKELKLRFQNKNPNSSLLLEN